MSKNESKESTTLEEILEIMDKRIRDWTHNHGEWNE
jgi:succinate dehydrogenase flavin-adding protein (antitoxin of CptAB toxin-antitoxin module)